jgi:VanZ family protein
MGLLFLASSQPGVVTDARLLDKLLHAVAYLVLGALVLRATHGGVRPLRLGPTVAAFLLTLAYGVSDEIHQLYVPGRTASVADVVADAIGAGLSIVLMGLLGALRARNARAAS